MNLTKILRNHSRKLLMVFMGLLLVAFLIPDAIQGLGSRERGYVRQYGQAFGRQIKDRDLDQARGDAQILTRVGLENIPEGAVRHYYLLSQEAQRLGIRVGREEVKAFLVTLGQQSPFWQPPEQRLKELQRASRRSYNEIYDAIGRWLAIDGLTARQATGLINTLPRQELAYRDRMQEADARLAIVDDKAFLAHVPEPTEEQLQAFFDECKGRRKAHTEAELVFGYLLEDRVQIEYLTVDPRKITGQVTVQAAQVRRYFEENASRYTKPDPLTTQPVDGRFPQVPMTFEEARDRAREDFRAARAIEVAQSLVNQMYNEAHRPWSTMPRDEAGFSEAPPDEPVSFRDLQQRFSGTYDITYGQTGLMDARQLRELPEFGMAGMLMGQQLVELSELALRVKGILEADPRDNKPVLNVMEPAVVLTYMRDPRTRQWSSPQQAYLFRVTDARPSAPLDEMGPRREDVVADWRLAQARELARQHAEALAARAREVGLAAAIEEATELKQILAEADLAASGPTPMPSQAQSHFAQDLEPFTPQRLTRSSTFIQPRVGMVKDLPREIFALAEAPVDEAAPHRAAVFPQADQHRWIVAELVEIKPLYAGPFEEQLAASLLDARQRGEEMRQFGRLWGQPDYVAQRTRFVPPEWAQPARDQAPEAP